MSNRKMIARILEKLGHTTVMAEDGITALSAHDEAVSTNRPFDFVFMDYVMPSKVLHFSLHCVYEIFVCV